MSLLSTKLYPNTGVLSLINTLSRTCLQASGIQVRNYAARKGTRERKAKKKVKVEVQKVGFIPHNQRNKEKMLALRPKLKFDDSWKQDPIDNVYCTKYFKWKVYPFEEAVNCHKETHHPEIYNEPNANLYVCIEMNMQGEKQTRFVENFTRIVKVPHPYEHGEERSIIAFCKNAESLQEAQKAGAQMAGGVELIKQIQTGLLSLSDFQFVVAHPDILPELVPLRGLMKRKFPNPKNGTLNIDIGPVVERFLTGINYIAIKDEYEKDFGLIKTILGPLNMSGKELESNFAALIQDVNLMKPKRKGEFISRCYLWSPPSHEKLKIDHNLYLKSTAESTEQDEEPDDQSESVAL